jgi:hypothetical protein
MVLLPVNRPITNKAMKMKKSTFAIPAAAAATPPKPKMAAMMAKTRNTHA